MKNRRHSKRFFLAAVACAAATCMTAGTASAQAQAPGAYPNKPIRFVVGFSAGNSIDSVARKNKKQTTNK